MIIDRDPYYTVNKLSNSRLSVVSALISGNSIQKAKKETLEFGRQLHQAVLQPELYALNLKLYPAAYEPFRYKVKALADACRKNKYLMYMLIQPECLKEHDHFFVHDRTGIECKMKMDLGLHNVIGDLKTTDTTTQEDFIAAAIAYDYHRQGAFYIDGTGADKFILFGISKKYPHRTFTWPVPDDLIEQGRERYENLMDDYLKLLNDGVDFQNLMQAA
jgi:hypothetical protein